MFVFILSILLSEHLSSATFSTVGGTNLPNCGTRGFVCLLHTCSHDLWGREIDRFTWLLNKFFILFTHTNINTCKPSGAVASCWPLVCWSDPRAVLQVVEWLHTPEKTPQAAETRGRRLQPVRDHLHFFPTNFTTVDYSGSDVYSDLSLLRVWMRGMFDVISSAVSAGSAGMPGPFTPGGVVPRSSRTKGF